MKTTKTDKGWIVVEDRNGWDHETQVADPTNVDGQAFVFSFGAYGLTNVIVFARGIEDALEEAAGWVADHAPGIFSEPEYQDAAKELGIVWPTEHEDEVEKVREHAETDHTYTESGWILSWEWHARDATDNEIAAAQNLATYLEAVDGLKDAIRGRWSTEDRAEIAAELRDAWEKTQA